ncbi:MAG: ABC transporter ATP-binding protein/permease [Tissierellia bacterium]|nr:ABC transporter ATP-binding protein/permease [Tissierellia bacterium]
MIEKRLLKTMEEERKYLFSIVFLKILSLLLNILMIFKIAEFIEDLLNYETKLLNFIGLLIVIILFQVYITKIQAKLSYKISKNIKLKLREKLFHKIYSYGLNYSEKVSPAEVVQLSVEGIEQLDMYFGNFIPQLMYSVIAPFILFIFLAPINLKVSLILLIIVPMIPLSIVKIQKLAKKVMTNYWGSYVNLSDVFLDDMKGMTILKVYKADEEKNRELNEISEKFRLDTMKVLSVQLNNITFMDLMAYGGAVIGTILSLIIFQQGEISLSGCIIFILISAEFFLPLRLLGSFFHIAMNGMAASDQLFDILELEEEASGEDTLEEPIFVQCKNINFSYGEKEILKDINMEIKPGRITSIVGKSGCGKSTIAKLIMGILKVKEGNLTYNGKENIEKDNKLKHLTLVDNAPYFFQGTLKYNLQMAKPGCTEEECWKVLEQVSLKEYFLGEEGLETMIQDQGNNLSGGQKQRLSLARALLKDGSLYIFDEATSNIDGESEDIIMNLIGELKKNKTILLISHRLKNTENSDYIYYMNQGKIEEEGRFEELLRQKGSFEHIYSHQISLEQWEVDDEK